MCNSIISSEPHLMKFGITQTTKPRSNLTAHSNTQQQLKKQLQVLPSPVLETSNDDTNMERDSFSCSRSNGTDVEHVTYDTVSVLLYYQ